MKQLKALEEKKRQFKKLVADLNPIEAGVTGSRQPRMVRPAIRRQAVEVARPPRPD
jgi:hypothetical protein